MNKEQVIKEARTIEAMKKGFMGLEGKFCSIAKRLGFPILQQGSRMFSENLLDDPFEEKDENEIPMMDEDENSYEIGRQFDGLSRGMNLTISVKFHLREITCRYEGRIVYQEMAGELEGYAPDPSWEDKIESLFSYSRKVERLEKPKERQQMLENAEKKRSEILEHLRSKWGL